MKLVDKNLHLMYVTIADLTQNGSWKTVSFYTQVRAVLAGCKKDETEEDVDAEMDKNQAVYYMGLDKTNTIPREEIESIERNDLLPVLIHEVVEEGHSLFLSPDGDLYETTELGEKDPTKKLLLQAEEIKIRKSLARLYRELKGQFPTVIIGGITFVDTNTICIYLDEYDTAAIASIPETYDQYIVTYKVNNLR